MDAENVQIYQTEGNTDEQCEALKLLFKDKDFVEKHRICSINRCVNDCDFLAIID